MKEWIYIALIYVITMLTIAAVSIAVSAKTGEVKCDKRWENSGLNTSYSFWGGCQVRLSSGKWVPEDRVRQSDIVTDYED